MKTFFTNFEEVFGHHEGVKLVMKTLNVPTIDITDDKTTVRAAVDLRFLNPYNNELETMKIHADLTAEVQFELLKNFQISGELKDLKLVVTEF